MQHEISSLEEGNAECLKIDFSTEDHGVPFSFGTTYTLQGFDILCLHPMHRDILIRLGVSQRFKKGGDILPIENEIAAFTSKLDFKDIEAAYFISPLKGRYAFDKFVFFPKQRNLKKEKLLMAAFKEGGCKKSKVYRQSASSEQQLAIEYDVAWAISNIRSVVPSLGCTLGKVGRWNESLKAFKDSSANGNLSAETLGNMGVVTHVLGRYENSVDYFNRAMDMKQGYFDTKEVQKKIFRASKKGLSVFDD